MTVSPDTPAPDSSDPRDVTDGSIPADADLATSGDEAESPDVADSGATDSEDTGRTPSPADPDRLVEGNRVATEGDME